MSRRGAPLAVLNHERPGNGDLRCRFDLRFRFDPVDALESGTTAADPLKAYREIESLMVHPASLRGFFSHVKVVGLNPTESRIHSPS
jgi:hypothetical protein